MTEAEPIQKAFNEFLTPDQIIATERDRRTQEHIAEENKKKKKLNAGQSKAKPKKFVESPKTTQEREKTLERMNTAKDKKDKFLWPTRQELRDWKPPAEVPIQNLTRPGEKKGHGDEPKYELEKEPVQPIPEYTPEQIAEMKANGGKFEDLDIRAFNSPEWDGSETLSAFSDRYAKMLALRNAAKAAFGEDIFGGTPIRHKSLRPEQVEASANPESIPSKDIGLSVPIDYETYSKNLEKEKLENEPNKQREPSPEKSMEEKEAAYNEYAREATAKTLSDAQEATLRAWAAKIMGRKPEVPVVDEEFFANVPKTSNNVETEPELEEIPPFPDRVPRRVPRDVDPSGFKGIYRTTGKDKLSYLKWQNEKKRAQADLQHSNDERMQAEAALRALQYIQDNGLDGLVDGEEGIPADQLLEAIQIMLEKPAPKSKQASEPKEQVKTEQEPVNNTDTKQEPPTSKKKKKDVKKSEEGIHIPTWAELKKAYQTPIDANDDLDPDLWESASNTKRLLNDAVDHRDAFQTNAIEGKNYGDTDLEKVYAALDRLNRQVAGRVDDHQAVMDAIKGVSEDADIFDARRKMEQDSDETI